MSPLGKKIIEARKLKGITQEELAEMSNINLRTIQRIENNESEPRSKTLILICDVLGMDFTEILSEGEVENQKGIAEKIVNALFLIILNMVLHNWVLLVCGCNTKKIKSRQWTIIAKPLH